MGPAAVKGPAHAARAAGPQSPSPFAACAGTVLKREAPKGIPKNGKRYHIHTFGCQVRAGEQHCRMSVRALPLAAHHPLPR